MPRNSMSRYNHGDRMNSYSQYNFKSNDDRGRRQYRNAEEPEWFSGGPTSQNDTIELRGFEEYTSGRQDDSPASPNNSDGADDDKAATAADYDSDTDKLNDESEKANDDNNNDNNDRSSTKDAAGTNHRESVNADKAKSTNDFDADDLEVAESKSNKKDDNFNFEDFLKGDNLTDLLAVSARTFDGKWTHFSLHFDGFRFV